MNISNGNDNGEIEIVLCSSKRIQSDEDDDDDCRSSAESSCCEEGSDFMTAAMDDRVTAQLAAAGPVGIAAAAAVVSSKYRKKKPHSFETNPAIRKRQQRRLLRKLRQTIDEFAIRVGHQAVVLIITPGKPNFICKVFGSRPLEDVIKHLRLTIIEQLENELAHQVAPPPSQDDSSLFELPGLVVDGIPAPVEKMTQAQLRSFIPFMIKYSTGRGKPGWGKESSKPPWWPTELPWANVRVDARSKDEKLGISWTDALRQVVTNCYKYHGRQDLLQVYSENDENTNATDVENANINTSITTQYRPTAGDQMDSKDPIFTLPDGTTVQVQNMTTIQTRQYEDAPVHTIQTISEGEVIDLKSVAEAVWNNDGQIVLTGQDGQVRGVITVPTTETSMFSNIQQLQTDTKQNDCMTPVIQMPKMEPNNGDHMDALTATPNGLTAHLLMLQGPDNEGAQFLQIFPLQDGTILTKAMHDVADVNTGEIVLSDI